MSRSSCLLCIVVKLKTQKGVQCIKPSHISLELLCLRLQHKSILPPFICLSFLSFLVFKRQTIPQALLRQMIRLLMKWIEFGREVYWPDGLRKTTTSLWRGWVSVEFWPGSCSLRVPIHVDTYNKASLYRPKSGGKVMLPSMEHLRIFSKYGELTGNKKWRNTILCVLCFLLCCSQIKKKIWLLGNCPKKCFIELGKWSIHSARVPRLDHTFSINGP